MGNYDEYEAMNIENSNKPVSSIDLHDVFNVLVEILEELKSINQKSKVVETTPTTPYLAKSNDLLKGMAEYFYAKGHLTEKQKAVVDNIYGGGSEKFLSDCSNGYILQTLNPTPPPWER